jgi:hypothetical protein
MESTLSIFDDSIELQKCQAYFPLNKQTTPIKIEGSCSFEDIDFSRLSVLFFPARWGESYE